MDIGARSRDSLPAPILFLQKLSTTFKPYFQFRLFIYNISLSVSNRNPAFSFFSLSLSSLEPQFSLSQGLLALGFSRTFQRLRFARSYSFSGAWFFEGKNKQGSRCAMEYGGGRKRFRPEAALNGNGGFKKSKPGMPSHCSSTYTRKHIFLLLYYVQTIEIVLPLFLCAQSQGFFCRFVLLLWLCLIWIASECG